MNKVVLSGRLCADPDVRYTQSETSMCIARYRLAVDRIGAKEGEQQADFINILALGKKGEFAEKYLKKGIKVIVAGKIQTGSYTNKDGVKVYTTEVLVDDQEFAESKKSNEQAQESGEFTNLPEGISEDDLPFTKP